MKKQQRNRAFEFPEKRLTEWSSCKKYISGRVLTGVVLTMLTLCVLLLVSHLKSDDRIVNAYADAEKTDDTQMNVSSSDSSYGHLFIDADPDNVIETDQINPEILSLCHQSFELHPDDSETAKTVTLSGMMPEGAVAEAVDVSRRYPEPDDISGETGSEATVVAAYSITIIDGENEYQPDETCPIRVEITDPSIVTEGITEVWHIKDNGTREQMTDIKVTHGKIVFLATGFSVYAIVNGPEPFVPEARDMLTSVAELTGERAGFGFFLCYADSGGTHYFQNTINTNGALKETADINAADKWFFEKDGSIFRLYTYVGNAKKYIHNGQDNSLELLTDNADLLEISEGEKPDSFYFKKKDEEKWLQHSGSGRGIRYWKDTSNKDNAGIYIYYADSGETPDDLYQLDGKSYGLTHYHTGSEGHALMADENSNQLELTSVVVRSDEQRKVLLVAKNCDITMWTFHSVRSDLYRISATVNGQTKYMKIGDTLSLTDEADASEIKVTPKDGMVMLSAGGRTVTFVMDTTFITEPDASGRHGQWLCLTEKSSMSQDDFVTYSADKVSISEAPNGASVILYTRVWNEDHKEYQFYAVGPYGLLYPCYERGDHIMWVGDKINSMLWTFIEYQYDDGSPKYYYELYNPYSRKFIAPQFLNDQILSDRKIGINLPGRREGHYYSSIVAWDPNYYAYAAVMNDTANNRIVSDNHEDADTYYFAMMNEPLKTLHKVATVDSSAYGITMKMINYPDASVQNDVLVKTGNNRGLLSTNLEENGYPKATYSNRSLAELYSGATEVNHLFIDSTYRSSHYFEYDSCQNFATLVDDDGTVGSNFRVYQELGTADNLDRSTFKHGQFFPYDTITAGVYSYRNPENLYGKDAVWTDDSVGKLPESDPRKYELLHTVGENPNYSMGMEINADFIQPPSGKDPWGHDIIFEFRGDDDFWLYVNDELIIDLGGIHSALTGTINFSSGDINVDGRRTNLREVFRSNYAKRNPDASDEEVEAYLRQFFADGEVIFKDYSYHSMKAFYMERGGGASNLHLRFNLSHIKPGNVMLTKKVSGSMDLDYHLMEYPYQIWYKDEDQGNIHLLHSDDENINVTYQYSTELVDYAEHYTPPNSPYSYEAVYFLNPGKSAEIHFPSNAIEYKVIECGVNTEVYDKVTVNGAEVEGESIGNTKRRLFDSGWLKVKDTPTVVFDNHVDPNGIRTLSIWKRLYDSDGNLIPPGQDDTRFSYRIYLSNGSDDVLKLADMRKYHVRDPEGNLCRWDAQSKKFISLGKPELAMLTDAERKAATFETSMNGAISMIPAGYDVGITGLPVGTRFRVVERANEMPLGYSLMSYERQGGTYLLEEGCDENTGWVRANESPTMYVNNKRGFEIKVDKEWSDAAFVDSHAPVYTAVYVEGRVLEGSVRRISHPDTSVRYYFDSLIAGKTLADYVIREVEVANPVVNSDGVVTSYSGVTPIEEDGHITLKSKPKNSDKESENEYFVEYTVGSVEATAQGIPSPGNIRSDLIENTRSEGVSITLRDMKTKKPIANGTFRLSHPEDGTLGTFTSDAYGKITILYDVKHEEEYTLTQAEIPDKYIGLPASLIFSIGSDAQNHTVTLSGVEKKWASGRGLAHTGNAASGKGAVIRNTAARHTGEPPVIAQIDVYNMPYTLQAVNICNRSGEPLEGAHFALYRSVTALDGEVKDYTPMPGYEDIVPGSDGIIAGIDNSLEPGKYYLTQNSPPANYDGIDTDVVFTVHDDSTVTLESTEHCALRKKDSEYERAYFLDVLNDYIPSYAKLTVTKTVGGSVGDTSRGFTFTVSVKGAPEDESYEWSRNGETMQTPLHSGDSFSIRHGESVTITVPRLIPITVTEQNDGYETTFRLGDGNEEAVHSKTFRIDSDMTLGVVNTLEPAVSSEDKPDTSSEDKPDTSSEDKPDSPSEETTDAEDSHPRSPGTGEGLLGITVSIVLLILAVIGSLTVLVIRFFGNEWLQEE